MKFLTKIMLCKKDMGPFFCERTRESFIVRLHQRPLCMYYYVEQRHRYLEKLSFHTFCVLFIAFCNFEIVMNGNIDLNRFQMGRCQ